MNLMLFLNNYKNNMKGDKFIEHNINRKWEKMKIYKLWRII